MHVIENKNNENVSEQSKVMKSINNAEQKNLQNID